MVKKTGDKYCFTDSPKVMTPSSYTLKIGKEHTCSTTKYSAAVIEAENSFKSRYNDNRLLGASRLIKHFRGQFLLENSLDSRNEIPTK